MVIVKEQNGNTGVTRPLHCGGFFASKLNITEMKFKLIVTFLLITVLGFAQNKGTITGILTDKDLNNETLPFANVVIKGTTIGVTTDETGKYNISVDAGSYTIQFSFLGYETIEEKIEVKAGETITLIVYFPVSFVVTPMSVPFITTLAKGSVSLFKSLSVKVPIIVPLFWAKPRTDISKKVTINLNFISVAFNLVQRNHHNVKVVLLYYYHFVL